MQKELEHKEEKIRILEAKNETLKQTAEAKTNEVEELKQKLAMLETEVEQKDIFYCLLTVLVCSYPPKLLKKRNYRMKSENCWLTLASMAGCVRKVPKAQLPTLGVGVTSG